MGRQHERHWHEMTVPQRRQYVTGFAMVVSGLLLGLWQPTFNGITLLAMLSVVVGVAVAIDASVRRG